MAYSVLETLRFAAARVLDMHLDDLQILVIGHVDREEVDALLWDPMPGGSGLLDQICQRFEEITAVAREVVEHCPAACEKSCIDCLQTFRNGYYHKYLDRKIAQERLAAWGTALTKDHKIPARQPSKPPGEGSHPVNEAERRLRHLLLAAGFEEGIRGQQIHLDRAIGTTTPDVIYRGPHHDEDEGVCIYLDGLSGHLHGNSATAEQDQRIRSWLRNNGYEVIEIAVSDLDDEGAMTRHFRKLAGYLDAGDLRDALRKDKSWFRQGSEAGTKNGRFVLRLVHPMPEDRFVNCVPLMPLKAAAGYFSEPQTVGDQEWNLDWVEIDTCRRLRKGMFVAQVVGKSMEPMIPDGAYCLFGSPVEGTRQGRTVLVLLRDTADPETGQRFTVKRYESEKTVSEDGTWRHVRIILKPTNKDFEPIILTYEDECSVEVVAELLEVLG
jgi:SOS-response transcriptional repressor LexA